MVGKKKNKKVKANNLKKRLIALENKYGTHYNASSTEQSDIQQGSPVYQRKQNFENETTNFNPELIASNEIDSINKKIDSKISEIRGEFKTETNYLSRKIDDLNDIIRKEGNRIREMIITKSFFYWVVGGLVAILSAIGYFAFNSIDRDVQEVKSEIQETTNDVQAVKNDVRFFKSDNNQSKKNIKSKKDTIN